MRPETILESLKKTAPRPYDPTFSVRKEADGWWLEDRGRPIAFLDADGLCFDPFEFSPFASLGREARVHPRYDMGTRINMHLALLTNVRGNFLRPDGELEVRWVDGRGDRVVVQIDQEHKCGVRARTTLVVDYRHDREAYGYEVASEVRESRPAQSREFCNFYAKHLGDGIPEQKKWQHTVWLSTDGRLWKFPHTPALTFGVRRGGALRKRVAQGGFIGFGTEDDFNPTVLFLDSNVPLLSATCDMWHDEHLMVDTPGFEYVRDGVGAARTRIELVNLDPATMAGLVEEARMIPLGTEEIEENPCLPLRWDEQSGMGAALDPRQPWAGMVFVPGEDRWVEIGDGGEPGYHWRYNEGEGRRCQWAQEGGRSGTRCLRLEGMEGRRVCWIPAGHAFHVEPATRYRFEAWVRTEGKARAAIWLGNVWHKIYDVSVKGETDAVSAPDWRKLELDLTTTDFPYLFPRLIAIGDGRVLFDDLRIGRHASGV